MTPLIDLFLRRHHLSVIICPCVEIVCRLCHLTLPNDCCVVPCMFCCCCLSSSLFVFVIGLCCCRWCRPSRLLVRSFFARLLVCSFVYSYFNSSVRSRSLYRSIARLLLRSFTCLLVRLFARLLVRARSLVRSFACLFVRSFACSLVCSFAC